MREEKKPVILWVAVTAVVAQQLAAFVGTPDVDVNHGHLMWLGLLAFMVIPVNGCAIAVFATRDVPALVKAVIAGLFLAWHGYALVLLSGVAGTRSAEFYMHVLANRTVGIAYQVTQVVAFGFVVLASITLHARQSVRPRRPARMRTPELPGA
ncbi:hypothetical protein [Lentzea sp. NPDC092896]|uniref:hypothetical protein n=1 Tax=Lentzea sp. NPDC092896 TaxID=3364127 RepID=UPI0038029D67